MSEPPDERDEPEPEVTRMGTCGNPACRKFSTDIRRIPDGRRRSDDRCPECMRRAGYLKPEER